MPLLGNLPGWNRWSRIRTIRGGRAVPHAVLPRGLYPASEFRSQFNSYHKVWYNPWRMYGVKPFHEFLAWTRPVHGGLTPVLDRLSAVLLRGIGNTILSGYGIGQIPPAPTCGFCMGDLYKEYQYFRAVLQRNVGGGDGSQFIIPGIGQIVGPIPISGGAANLDEMSLTMTSSIFQRSRLRKMYMHHGTVSSYGTRIIDDEEVNVLELDVSGRWSGGSFPVSTIDITHFNSEDGTSSSVSVSITSVTEDFRFIVGAPSGDISPGDFYEFSSILCIQDPNLLTGIYFGTENEGNELMRFHFRNEKLSQIVCQGVYNEFNESSDIETNDRDDDWDEPWGYLVSNADIANQYWYYWNTNAPFPTGDELSEVIFKDDGGESTAFNKEFNNSGDNLHITTDNRFYEKIVFTGFYILKGDGGIQATNAGDSFYDSAEGVDLRKWHWVKSDDYDKSEIYQKVEDRYWSTGDFYTVDSTLERDPFDKREVGSMSDVTAWIENDDINFIRAEISRGGDSKRNNWHSPILAREWLVQSGRYFKILAQPDGNVIDVSLRDITGTYELNIDEDATIFNQYGWFISEHYWGNGVIPLFQATEVISASGLQIKYKYRTPTGDTISNPHAVDDDENTYSFYNRFKYDSAESGGTTKAWKKYNGWKLTGDSGNVLPIDYVEFEGNDTVLIVLNESVGEISIDKLGDLFDNGMLWITFDEPYIRTNPTTYGPIFDAEPNILLPPVEEFESSRVGDRYQNRVNMVKDAGRVQRELAIYVDSTSLTGIKLNINKELIVGICGGRWFGEEPWPYVESSSEDYIQIDEAIAMPYNDNSYPLQLTTKYGTQGISCIYDQLSQTSWVAYNDVYTGRLTIRKGQLDFKENPQKIEVSCGKTPNIQEFGSFPITLNDNYDRVKLIDMEVDTSDYGYHLFTIGGSSSYHGFLIDANGDFKLSPFSFDGSLDDITAEDYKYNNFFCSPVYLYHVNKNNRKSRQTLYIGMDTQDGPVGVENGVPSNISVEYIHNVQTIQGDSYIDLHHISSGEVMIVYSKQVIPFRLNGDMNNSEDEDNAWRNKNCVHICSTLDGGRTWGCPITNKTAIDPEKYQWPVMVLNSVNYKFSLYDQISQVLTVFCECSKLVGEGDLDEIQRPFLAALKIPIYSLAYGTELCQPEPFDDKYNFLIRYPRIESEEIEWTDDSFKPIGIDAPSSNLIDQFIKIIGHPDTESQIEDDNVSYGNVHGFISDQGFYNLLLDYDGGIGLVFSSNSGMTWQKSEIQLSRGASSGLFIGRYLLYITENGIESKLIDPVLFQKAGKCVAGFDADFIEETQEEFDEIPSVVVIGGNISPQRLTGYEDSRGIGYLFYYNSSGILSSLISHNFQVWEFADNF